MVDFIGAARDPQFRQDVGQGLVDAFGRGLAMVGGAPVDLTTMFLRPLGYSAPDEQIVGSSEYIGRQMANLGLISETRNPAAEFLSALLIPDPTDIQKLAPVIERGISKAAQNISAPRTLNRQAGQIGVTQQKPQAPREEALRIAQENAAKPVSEGGLGLPPDNTAMDRARAMGFEESGYHGTAEDFVSYDPKKTQRYGSGSREGPLGAWLTDDPRVASDFASWSARGQGGDVVYPMMIRGEAPAELTDYSQIRDIVDENTKFMRAPYRMMQDEVNYQEAINQLQELGDYVALRNTKTDAIDRPITQFLVTDPSRLRSRFAAFDPARRYESDLLGSVDPRLLAILGPATAAAVYGLGELYANQRRDEQTR